MRTRKLLSLIFISFSFSTLLFGQKNELSLSVGGLLTSDQHATSVLPITCPVMNPNCNVVNSVFTTDPGVVFEGTYARRIVGLGPASLYLEVPVAGGPGRDTRTSFTSGLITGITVTSISSSSLFFTPSAKVKFLASAPISPFATVGGGLAHSAVTLHPPIGISSSVSSRTVSSNNGALQFGGGLDFKSPIPHVGFRAEVRDFYCKSTLQSSSLTTVSPVHVHNVFAGGGAFLRF